jgi:hypothetical protein
MDNGINGKGDGATDDNDNNGVGATDDDVDKDGNSDSATDDDGDSNGAADNNDDDDDDGNDDSDDAVADDDDVNKDDNNDIEEVRNDNLPPRVGKRNDGCNQTQMEEEETVADSVVINTTFKQITGRGGGRW